MRPYRSLCVLMDSNGCIWVLIGLYASLWVLMGPNKFLCVLMDSNESFWVLISRYMFLRIVLGIYGSL